MREGAHPIHGRAEGKCPLQRKRGEALAHTDGNREMENVTQCILSVSSDSLQPLKGSLGPAVSPAEDLSRSGTILLSVKPVALCPQGAAATLGTKAVVQGV